MSCLKTLESQHLVRCHIKALILNIMMTKSKASLLFFLWKFTESLVKIGLGSLGLLLLVKTDDLKCL